MPTTAAVSRTAMVSPNSIDLKIIFVPYHHGSVTNRGSISCVCLVDNTNVVVVDNHGGIVTLNFKNATAFFLIRFPLNRSDIQSWNVFFLLVESPCTLTSILYFYFICKGAITKRMTTIKEIASMNVLYSDKTGTLTLNRLTIDKILIMVSILLIQNNISYSCTQSSLYSSSCLRTLDTPLYDKERLLHVVLIFNFRLNLKIMLKRRTKWMNELVL